jgi:hypothetical protein
VLATYASTVKDRSGFIKRTQSLNKISSVGLGVIYYWHWGWASVPTKTWHNSSEEYRDKLKKDLRVASEGGEASDFTTRGDPDKEKLYGRFMYLGLTVQNPTMTRINAHIGDAKTSGGTGPNSKANSLYQAITAGATELGSEGTIADPTKIPNVLHLVSWFDLDALEAYYIQKKFGLGNPAAQSFGQQVQKSSFANTNDGITRGVNTAGGGQGGTFKQDIDRGPAEWISAAYYFIKETDSDVLSARNFAGLSGIAEKADSLPTLGEKVKYVFDAFSKIKVESSQGPSNLVIPSIIKLFASYDLGTINTYLEIMGYKDKQTLGVRGKDKTLTEEQIQKQLNDGGFSTRNLMNEVGGMLDTMFSYDVDNKQKQSISMFTSKESPDNEKTFIKFTLVKTELRKTMLDDFLGFSNEKKKFIANAESIKQKIAFSFENGLSKTDKILSQLKDRHNKLAKQNKELSSKYMKFYSRLKTERADILKLIETESANLQKLIKKHFMSVGGESIIEGVAEFMLLSKKKKTAGAKPSSMAQIEIQNKQTAAQLKNKYKAPTATDPKVLNELYKVLGKIYNKFSALQSLISRVIEGQEEEVIKFTKAIQEDNVKFTP